MLERSAARGLPKETEEKEAAELLRKANKAKTKTEAVRIAVQQRCQHSTHIS